uniref:Uncharacterized protein n=1 Tax=Cacopsylla melanoneura TaxID=428564 RepID=A0A8D8T3F1_9HEMI
MVIVQELQLHRSILESEIKKLNPSQRNHRQSLLKADITDKQQTAPTILKLANKPLVDILQANNRVDMKTNSKLTMAQAQKRNLHTLARKQQAGAQRITPTRKPTILEADMMHNQQAVPMMLKAVMVLQPQKPPVDMMQVNNPVVPKANSNLTMAQSQKRNLYTLARKQQQQQQHHHHHHHHRSH